MLWRAFGVVSSTSVVPNFHIKFFPNFSRLSSTSFGPKLWLSFDWKSPDVNSKCCVIYLAFILHCLRKNCFFFVISYGGLTFGERQAFNQLMDDFSEPISSTDKDSVKTFADKLSNALRDNYEINLGASNITLESFFAKMRSFAEQLITRKIIKVIMT